MELSAWVKLARTKKGWTQDQMADALGVTKGNVSAWENGRHEPGWAKILKIGRETGQPLPVPPELQEPIAKDAAELLTNFDVLSPEDRTLTLAYVKRLADLTSEKVNSVTAEKSGTISQRAGQTVIRSGVSSLDEAVSQAEGLLGGEDASSKGRVTGGRRKP